MIVYFMTTLSPSLSPPFTSTSLSPSIPTSTFIFSPDSSSTCPSTTASIATDTASLTRAVSTSASPFIPSLNLGNVPDSNIILAGKTVAPVLEVLAANPISSRIPQNSSPSKASNSTFTFCPIVNFPTSASSTSVSKYSSLGSTTVTPSTIPTVSPTTCVVISVTIPPNGAFKIA